MFLNIIFALFILMIVKTAWLLHKENEVVEVTICDLKITHEGGRPMKHFNGRFFW